jgi:2-succinyl-6-hydroxy-2,4-cyclohexadiene-1-carboxylate synthase
MLACEVDGSGPRLVLVHGFTQTARSWGKVAESLAEDHEVVRVDAPGHGRSARVEADLGEGAELLVATAGVGTYVGYSMGGRLCLHAGLAQPDEVTGLVLLGATAGIEDPRARAERVAADECWARSLEVDGVDAFLRRWLAQPLFAGLDEAGAGLDARRENTAAGLAASLRQAGTGVQEALWDRLGALSMPVLVLAGERDERFAALGERLVASVGDNASLAAVPGAGHAAHLEAPEAVLAVLRPWLADHKL